eukprot:scaffold6561_cov73-Skeletonema_dohrnii-CCMP3373.AAC.1
MSYLVLARTRCPLGIEEQQMRRAVAVWRTGPGVRLRVPIEDSLARQRCEPKIWQLLMVRNQSRFVNSSRRLRS